jgi:hypothetical protein
MPKVATEFFLPLKRFGWEWKARSIPGAGENKLDLSRLDMKPLSWPVQQILQR